MAGITLPSFCESRRLDNILQEHVLSPPFFLSPPPRIVTPLHVVAAVSRQAQIPHSHNPATKLLIRHVSQDK